MLRVWIRSPPTAAKTFIRAPSGALGSTSHRAYHKKPQQQQPQQRRESPFNQPSDIHPHGRRGGGSALHVHKSNSEFMGRPPSWSRRGGGRFQRSRVPHHHTSSNSVAAASSATISAQTDGGGEIPTVFRYIDATAVTALARDFVTLFMKRQGNLYAEPMTVPCPGDPTEDPHGNRKIAILIVEVTTGQRVQAVGRASRRETAVALCYMHAQELIDHYTTQGAASSSNNGDSGDADDVNGDDDDCEGAAGEPLPLAVRESTNGLHGGLRPPARPSYPQRSFGHATQPMATEDDRRVWQAYIDRVSTFLAEREQLTKARAYQAYTIPHDLGIHPIHDAAAAGMLSWRGIDPSAASRLHNRYQQGNMLPVPEMVFVRAFGAFVATLPVGADPGLISIGIGRNKKDARVRCAMHALEMFRIKDIIDNEKGTAANGGSGGGGGVSPFFEAISTLSPSQSKLFETYILLTQVKTRSTFRKERNGRSTAVYACTFEVGDLKVEGMGINRTEAERAAALIAMEELEQYDPMYSRVAGFVKENPDFDPTMLQQVELQPDMLQDVKMSIEKCRGLLASLGMDVGHLSNLSEAHVTVRARNSIASSFLPSSQEATAGQQEQEVLQSRSRASVDGTAAASERARAPVDADVFKVLSKLGRSRLVAAQERRNTAMGITTIHSERMRESLARMRRDPQYLAQFHPRRSTLAMASVQQQVVDTLAKHRVVIICGTTGCGKTTQVPQYILDHEIAQGRGDTCSIVVSQPRRISAYSIAERIASERLQKIGEDVGYSIRLDSKPGSHITLCTTGILLQMFVSQPDLPQVSHLIIDEIHERDINGDVALALGKELLARNPNIRMVLMSATLEAEKFSKYFDNAPIVSVEGQTYPVQEIFLEDIAAVAKTKGFHSPRFEDMVHQRQRLRTAGRMGTLMTAMPPKLDYSLVAFAVDESIRSFAQGEWKAKSVLVFLPGWKELLAAKNALEMVRNDLHIVLLHSTVEAAKQNECFRPPPHGRVKVVLATNIAESGITIDDAAVVIDTGLIKLTSDSMLEQRSYGESGSGGLGEAAAQQSATQLSLVYASKANCTQRRGRAGRTQGGVCVRLFSREVWDAMPAFLHPEILRTPLEQVVIRLLAMGYEDPQGMLATFVDAPNPENVARALETLRALDAVESVAHQQDNSKSNNSFVNRNVLTSLGLYLSLLPCEPRIGKMIVLGAMMNCLDTVLTLAAANDVQPFVVRRDLAAEVRKKRFVFAQRTQSDHMALVNAYNSFVANDGTKAYANQHFLNWNNMTLISKYKQQFSDILANAGLVGGSPTTAATVRSRRGGSSGGGDGGDTWFVERSEHSSMWNNLQLVKACLAACLYPNIAVLDDSSRDSGNTGADTKYRRKKPKGRLSMRLRNGMTMSPSRESACRPPDRARQDANNHQAFLDDSDDGTEASWELDASFQFMYQGIFKIQESNQTFLTTVSSVSPWAIVLLAAPAQSIRYDPDTKLCTVSDWMVFYMPLETFNVVLAIKKLFLACLMRKYQHPRDSTIDQCLDEVRRVCSLILHAPIQLLAQQRTVNMNHTKGTVLAPWASKEDIRVAEQSAMDDDRGIEEDE